MEPCRAYISLLPESLQAPPDALLYFLPLLVQPRPRKRRYALSRGGAHLNPLFPFSLFPRRRASLVPARAARERSPREIAEHPMPPSRSSAQRKPTEDETASWEKVSPLKERQE